MHGRVIDGSDRPLIVKHAEDQHSNVDQRRYKNNVHSSRRFQPEPYLYLPVEVAGPFGMANPALGYSTASHNTPYLMNSGSIAAAPYPYHIKYSPDSPLPESGGLGPPLGWYSGTIPYDPRAPVIPPANGFVNSANPTKIRNLPLQNVINVADSFNGPAPEHRSVSVSILGLPPDATSASLATFFSTYGRVLSARVDTAGTGNSPKASKNSVLYSYSLATNFSNLCSSTHLNLTALVCVNLSTVLQRERNC